jgi:Zn-dependent protease
VLFILAVFLCVVLHEFGHALAARRYGIKTHDIILLPIGGVARLEKMPTNPLHELWIALAGPAVNIAIVSALFIWLKLTPSLEPIQTPTLTIGSFLERVMMINMYMAIFNMIPAFPMDGGRVLHAVLATRQEYGRATQIAASIGQGIAILFGIFGLFYNPFLLLIALFVRLGTSQEAGLARMQSVIGGIPVQHAMVTDFKTLNENDSLDRAVELTLAGSQKDFPVVDNGRIEGILTQNDLLKALSARDKHPTITAAMQQNFITDESLDMLESHLQNLKNAIVTRCR